LIQTKPLPNESTTPILKARGAGGVVSLGSKKWDNCFVYRERELNHSQLKNLSLASNRDDV